VGLVSFSYVGLRDEIYRHSYMSVYYDCLMFGITNGFFS
jgi:hypothetical protein